MFTLARLKSYKRSLCACVFKRFIPMQADETIYIEAEKNNFFSDNALHPQIPYDPLVKPGHRGR